MPPGIVAFVRPLFVAAVVVGLFLVTSPMAAQSEVVFRPAVTAAGYIYVSGLTAPGAGADITAQTRAVLDRLKTVLEAAGSSMGQLCSVQVSLKSASDFGAMNTAYRAVFSADAPTRTTIVSRLGGAALIEVSAVGLPNGARRETMQPAAWVKSPRPYSYIVKTDDLVFFSGLISRKGTDDSTVTGDIRTQVTTILDNAGTLLATAGLSYADVVAARVYITSPQDFAGMNEVYATYFSKDPPARATAVVDLMSTDSIAEITLIASRKPKRIIGAPQSGIPLSAAVEAGPRVWLSGVIGDTGAHPNDVAAQTRGVFTRMSGTLKLAGLDFSDVVDTTIYLYDLADAPKVDAVFKEIFPANPPARTLTGARLVVAPGLVEVLMMAVRKQK